MAIADGTGWQFWVDRGGTFTDVVARRPDGAIVTRKLPSVSPGRDSDAALHAIRSLLGVGTDAPIPSQSIDGVRIGTTVATNALLERSGERTLLLTTRGFADALRIGDQSRPDIFARHLRRPEPPCERIVEIAGRLAADGSEVEPLDRDAAAAALADAHRAGLRSVAVALMHGFRDPRHEVELVALARAAGFREVVASHQVLPLMKLVERTETTVADAYLTPVLRRYVEGVAGELDGVPLWFMQSSGGLVDAGGFRGTGAILSGPAGGVVGAIASARRAGIERIVAFDMGGTSTDVSHYAGRLERSERAIIGGVRLRTPMVDVHTVAAGGGSVLHFDGERSRVGPDSAGSVPGPACYGRGGPLTVTDCNVLLGRIVPDAFPALFGPESDRPLDVAVVQRRFDELARRIERDTGVPHSPEAAAQGYLAIAVDGMARAIKKISLQRGHDLADAALCAFGGAAGQLACAVADELGVRRVLVPRHAGLLSAWGIGHADLRTLRQHAIEAPLDGALDAPLAERRVDLERRARAELTRQGLTADRIRSVTRLRVRYTGSDRSLDVPYGTFDSVRAAFEQTHRRRFGFAETGRALTVESIAVEAIGSMPPADTAPPAEGDGRRRGATELHLGDGRRTAALFHRDDLRTGQPIDGPAIVIEDGATTVIEPSWRGCRLAAGDLMLERVAGPAVRSVDPSTPDPVLLEVFNNRFMAIAEQMGATLENTAHSVNIKERLDFSCAVFDAEGGLVANAPHMPVHLGSMGEAVRSVRRAAGGAWKAGDAFAHNAPYSGGTHLPDVTVVAPVFDDGGRVRFFVAARGHHADIGGITPGSMPPASRTIDEEGVLLDGLLVVRDGRMRREELLRTLASGPFPARNPERNVADLEAQVAACSRGIDELRRLVEERGLATVQAYMGHVARYADSCVRRAIDRLSDGHAVTELDDGSRIEVTVSIDRTQRRARIDFTGTSPQHPTNFNAPSAVGRAAVLYVFRTLVDDDIPLNEGCLVPLEIVIPDGSLLAPRPPAAVVAGNVETSQCITDVLYRALGELAASQGTMNNLTFGDAEHQYYETIAGGSGAGPGFPGADAIQTHMTNSRLTDPEVLESRFPVRVESFAVRTGSGGDGRHRGGDGAVRTLRFLAPMSAAILSGRRRVAPAGVDGGGDGAVGLNRLVRADGTELRLDGCAAVEVGVGDRLIVETPGGGGFGRSRRPVSASRAPNRPSS